MPRRNTSRYHHRSTAPYEILEDRIVFSVSPAALPDSVGEMPAQVESFEFATGVSYSEQFQAINIHGTEFDDVAQVTEQVVERRSGAPTVMTHVSLGHVEMIDGQRTFVETDSVLIPQEIDLVRFWGYEGNDQFANLTAIASYANGGEGDDLLIGGGAADALNGNVGNDELHGNAGADVLSGGDGNDALYGGDGNDTIYGDAGRDLLVTIGGMYDQLSGGAGVDSVWMDPTDTLADPSNTEVEHNNIHQVASFMDYSHDGGATSSYVSKELFGQILADPLPDDSHTQMVNFGLQTLQNFADNPLFASNGPTKDDIDQGQVGDCYFVATLSAIADADPNFVRQMVVDLGDGTYAVRFYENGQETYVRVDADLYVDVNGNLTYANLGQEDSLWVAIVEKAFAYFRYKQGSYQSINSGDGDLHQDFNLLELQHVIDDDITPEQVIAWESSGSPAGAMQNAVTTGALFLLEWMDEQLSLGNAVFTGARSSVSDSIALQVDDPETEANESTFRRGQHVFMVDSVLKDSTGAITGVTLRDPRGGYVTLMDFTRIYFCLTAGHSYVMNPLPELGFIADHISMKETQVFTADRAVAVEQQSTSLNDRDEAFVREFAGKDSEEPQETVLATDPGRYARVEESAIDAAFSEIWDSVESGR